MITRRLLLKTIGAAGTIGVAGCLSVGGEADSCETLETEPNYRGWLDDTSNYVGTCDHRGTNSVSVQNGAKANNAHWGFKPAAVAVSPGTTVRWEWTGNGGAHDVVAERGEFASGSPTDDAGTTFEYRFDDPGLYKYSCSPHRAMGMKGAIFVALE